MSYSQSQFPIPALNYSKIKNKIENDRQFSFHCSIDTSYINPLSLTTHIGVVPHR